MMERKKWVNLGRYGVLLKNLWFIMMLIINYT